MYVQSNEIQENFTTYPLSAEARAKLFSEDLYVDEEGFFCVCARCRLYSRHRERSPQKKKGKNEEYIVINRVGARKQKQSGTARLHPAGIHCLQHFQVQGLLNRLQLICF